MASERVQRFLDALGALEASNDAGPMLALFTEDCEVGNVVAPERFHGIDEAKRFWSEYRDAFRDIRSEFVNLIESADRAALEWVSTGESASGHSLSYQGVSILEFQGDQIRRFMAFFDSGKLGRQFEGREGRAAGQEREVPAFH